MIRVQQQDFDVAAELAALPAAGGICVFVGTVRDVSDGRPVAAMTLEHYPGMAERELARLEEEAQGRWPLAGVAIVHRYGRLQPGERIVLVAVAAPHRAAAFEACRFLIDRLKTEAPFWKSEETAGGARWVAARREDAAAAERWDS
ncbi:MAG: molybdenum cofactor biosynthesis protein MoaE [Rhodospirillales bacterium]|nr:molybdenum cofactor biosynthesis protein MoaE [Rhodospirillales bacterium]